MKAPDIRRMVADINKNGILRNNKFLFRAIVNDKVAQIAGDHSPFLIGRDLELSGEVAALPGVQFGVQEVRRYGYGAIEKKPYVPVFTDIQLAFRSDAKGKIWTFLTDWMRLAINHQAPNGMADRNSSPARGSDQMPYEVNYKDQYALKSTITIFDDHGDVAIEVALREAYPIYVADIPLNWGAKNDYIRIPTVLTFYDWYRTRPVLASQPSSK
jgi:hypothetical protein